MVVDSKHVLPLLVGLTGRGHQGVFWCAGVFYSVVVVWVYIFVKIHSDGGLRFMHLPVCKTEVTLYLKINLKREKGWFDRS